jgi:hypothetical protein
MAMSIGMETTIHIGFRRHGRKRRGIYIYIYIYVFFSNEKCFKEPNKDISIAYCASMVIGKKLIVLAWSLVLVKRSEIQ